MPTDNEFTRICALYCRRLIMCRRRISDEALAAWFCFEPAALPVGQPIRIGGRASARRASDYVAEPMA